MEPVFVLTLSPTHLLRDLAMGLLFGLADALFVSAKDLLDRHWFSLVQIWLFLKNNRTFAGVAKSFTGSGMIVGLAVDASLIAEFPLVSKLGAMETLALSVLPLATLPGATLLLRLLTG